MRTIVTSLLLVVAPCWLWAYSPRVERVTITNLGIYELGIKREDGNGRKPSRRSWDVVTRFKRVKSMSTIPARPCISFGFEYTIVGVPVGAEIPLRMVTKFPSQGVYNPETRQTTYRNEAVVRRTIGRMHFRSYTLDEPWVLVPGTWTFELWYRDRKLAEQSFTITLLGTDGFDETEMQRGNCEEGLVSLSGYDAERTP